MQTRLQNQEAEYEKGKKEGAKWDNDMRRFDAAAQHGDADYPDHAGDPVSVRYLFWAAGFIGLDQPKHVQAVRIGKCQAKVALLIFGTNNSRRACRCYIWSKRSGLMMALTRDSTPAKKFSSRASSITRQARTASLSSSALGKSKTCEHARGQAPEHMIGRLTG